MPEVKTKKLRVNGAATENGNPNNQKSSINVEGLGGIIGGASKIVLKAANILEEEIARGIVTAKEIEGKFTDVSKLRNGNHDELLTRFRKDIHEIVDIFMDIAALTVKNAGNITSNFIKIKQETTEATTAATAASNGTSTIPLIRIPGKIKAGEKFQVPINLENDNSKEAKSVQFENTALIDAAGNQIPATAIKFTPNPLVLAPGASAPVNILISIPKSAAAGTYTSFVQAKNMDMIKATLLIEVEKAEKQSKE